MRNELGFIALLDVFGQLPITMSLRGGFAAVAIPWYKPTAIVALNAEVRTKRYHTLKCSGHPTAYREIATGLAALAMTSCF